MHCRLSVLQGIDQGDVIALSTFLASASLLELAPHDKQCSVSGYDDMLLYLSFLLSFLCFEAHCLILNPRLKIVFLPFFSLSLLPYLTSYH